MKKALMASIPMLLIVGFFALPVVADDTLARFKGGIGVIPVSSGVGTGATAEVVNRTLSAESNPLARSG